jgi:hypothetical protein
LVVTTSTFDQGKLELELELELKLKLELKLELEPKPKLPAETRSIAAALSCVGWADATALIAKRAPKAIINAFMNPSIRSVFYRLFHCFPSKRVPSNIIKYKKSYLSDNAALASRGPFLGRFRPGGGGTSSAGTNFANAAFIGDSRGASG